MATEIDNIDGSPDPDDADGEFQQPLPEWVKVAADRFMASSLAEQLAFILKLRDWCRKRGDIEGVQHAEGLLKGLTYEVANPFTLEGPASENP